MTPQQQATIDAKLKDYMANPKNCPVFQKYLLTSLLSGLAKQGEKF